MSILFLRQSFCIIQTFIGGVSFLLVWFVKGVQSLLDKNRRLAKYQLISGELIGALTFVWEVGMSLELDFAIRCTRLVFKILIYLIFIQLLTVVHGYYDIAPKLPTPPSLTRQINKERRFKFTQKEGISKVTVNPVIHCNWSSNLRQCFG